MITFLSLPHYHFTFQLRHHLITGFTNFQLFTIHLKVKLPIHFGFWLQSILVQTGYIRSSWNFLKLGWTNVVLIYLGLPFT